MRNVARPATVRLRPNPGQRNGKNSLLRPHVNFDDLPMQGGGMADAEDLKSVLRPLAQLCTHAH